MRTFVSASAIYLLNFLFWGAVVSLVTEFNFDPLRYAALAIWSIICTLPIIWLTRNKL